MNNTIPKTVWGQYFWSVFHIVAIAYPELPSLQDKENYETFYRNFGNVLPCAKCSKNYKRHLVELPITPYLENGKTLFRWTVMIHNIVNRELGKTQWEENYAYMHYINLRSITYNNQEVLKKSNDNLNNNSIINGNKDSVQNSQSTITKTLKSDYNIINIFMILINIILIVFLLFVISKQNS